AGWKDHIERIRAAGVAPAIDAMAERNRDRVTLHAIAQRAAQAAALMNRVSAHFSLPENLEWRGHAAPRGAPSRDRAMPVHCGDRRSRPILARHRRSREC